MASVSVGMLLKEPAQEGIINFLRQCYSAQTQQWNFREQLRAVDVAYLRENDWTEEQIRSRTANKYGDPNKLQNVTIPVVMPAVEAATNYQASVFLTGNPLFGVVASPQFQDAAMQLETIIDNQAIRGGWVQEFTQFFRDGFKYNISAIEIPWIKETVPALIPSSGKDAEVKEVLWEGNKVRRLDPYNFFWDMRVPATEIHKAGEFAGYTELMSRIALKRFISRLPDHIIENVKKAFESGTSSTFTTNGNGIGTYFIPTLNPAALINRDVRMTTDWMAWAGLQQQTNGGAKINYKNFYEVTTLYGRILPSEFGIKVPQANTPQIWKFIIVNHSVIIYAERQTNAHDYIPIIFGVPKADGLNYQSKSLAQNVQPFQDVTSTLMNSLLASRRRAISDRGLYDPSRVDEKHINSTNPSAKIPVRPAAYGKPLQEAYFPIPYRDDQAQLLTAEIQQLTQLANTLSGQNAARQGQFVKGNKTLHEYQSVMANASSQDQVTAMLLECQVMTPLKEILKQNILQYQGPQALFNRSANQEVNIDPVQLRQAVLQFKLSDGLMPTDKLIASDALQTALQVVGSSPQIGQAYNIGQLFSYLMKTQHCDLTFAEKSKAQVAYEQAMQQWQMLAMEAMKHGVEFKSPQPKPTDYGYDPNQQGISGGAAPQVTNKVNNITNNISNNVAQ